MLIQDDNKSIEFVKSRVELLVGSFPQIKWDVNMTSASWMLMLNDNKTTREELDEAIKRVVNNGFNDWEVNLSLILQIVHEIRRENVYKQKDISRMKGKKITLEKFKELKKQYGF